MRRLDTVTEALHLWNIESHQSEHLAEETLLLMAQDGELANANKSDMKHLSSCSVCMETWSAWRSAIADIESETETSLSTGYGFLQAADSGWSEPFKLISACGRFVIDILPQEDNPTRAMMAFEIIDHLKDKYEGQYAILRDKNGKIIIQALVESGQFARVVDHIDHYDLRNWTVFFR